MLDTFYICPTCGDWQNVAFIQTLSNAFAALSPKFSPEFPQTGVLCPKGHGAMRQVQVDDKLAFRPKLEVVPDEEQPDDISRSELISVLKRLASYYGDRARIGRKHACEATDCQLLTDRAVVADRWEAKHDAVLKVAENLGIEVEPQEE